MLRIARVLLLILAVAVPTAAHNTAVAVAAPLEGIVVDGDLSDWPEDLPRYRVESTTYITDPEDEADLLAWFRVGFDAGGRYLYLAVEALDQEQVVIDTSREWNASDGVEVFLDLAHELDDAACVQHVIYGVQHVVERSGVDSVAADPSWAAWAVDRSGGRHRYEWRFDVAGMSQGQVQLAPGMSLGLDVAVADRDADGSFTWISWGPGIGKLGTPSRLGDLALVPAGQSAQLWGMVRWSDAATREPPPRRLRIADRERPERMWLEVAADIHGRYEAEVAPGEYTVEPVDLRVRRDDDAAVRVKARGGERRQVHDLVVPTVRDRSVLVDQLFDFIEPGQPGAAVLVARDDEVLHARGYGLANVELDVPMTTHSKCRIASVSKEFTVAALMLLVEEGRLDLDAPLSTYLPDYPHADEVTTRQLMSHTSGIPNYLGMSSFWKIATESRDMAGLLEVFQDLDLDFEPGTRYSYSNSGFVVLAHLLETLSGQTYAQFLQERIFTPLGMNDTGIDHYRPIVKNRASGYALDAKGLVNTAWLDMGLLVGAGNIYSTAEDMLKWDEGLYQHTVLGPASLTAMCTPQTLADGNSTAYGLGFRLGEQGGLPTVGHAGLIGGFTSQFTRFPEQHFTVIVLDNSPWIYPGELASQIAEIYLAGEMTWEVAQAD